MCLKVLCALFEAQTGIMIAMDLEFGPTWGWVKGYIHPKLTFFKRSACTINFMNISDVSGWIIWLKPSWIYIIWSEKHNFLHSVSRWIFQTGNLYCLGRLPNSQRLESGLKVAPMTVRVSCRDPATTVQLKTLPGEPKGNPWCGADWMCIMLV